MYKLLSNNRGAALAMMIMFMVVMTIIGVSFLSIGLSETKFSIASEKNLQAEYIAKAGVDIAAEYFIRDNTTTLTNIFPSPIQMGKGNINSATATITDHAGNRDDEVIIKSTGEVDSSVRAVSVRLTKKSDQEVFDGIKVTGEKSEFDLSAMDIGYDAGDVVNVVANVPTDDDISLASVNEGDSNIVKTASDVQLPPVIVTPKGIYTSPSAIAGPYTLSEPYYELEKLSNRRAGDTIHFQVASGNDLVVVVDQLEFKESVTITGGGNVRIFIRESGTVQTPINVNTAGTGYLFYYVAKDAKLEFRANGIVSAYIYGPEATILINSDQTTIEGSMIGNVIIKNPSGEGPHGHFYFKPLQDDDTYFMDYGYKKRNYFRQ